MVEKLKSAVVEKKATVEQTERRRKLEQVCENPFVVDEDDCDRLTRKLINNIDLDHNQIIIKQELKAFVTSV